MKDCDDNARSPIGLAAQANVEGMTVNDLKQQAGSYLMLQLGLRKEIA